MHLGRSVPSASAGRALGIRIEEANDAFVEAGGLSRRLARGLQRVREFDSVAGQLAAVEASLGKSADAAEDPLISEAVRRMAAGFGDVGGLARELGISTRQLERRFVHEVGLRPKLFFRMQRFQRVFRAIGRDPSRWADRAAECGYYDQAHLIRDFKEFAGEAPAMLLAGAELARHFLRHRPDGVSHFSKTDPAVDE